jgi:hypothetical protein
MFVMLEGKSPRDHNAVWLQGAENLVSPSVN